MKTGRQRPGAHRDRSRGKVEGTVWYGNDPDINVNTGSFFLSVNKPDSVSPLCWVLTMRDD